MNFMFHFLLGSLWILSIHSSPGVWPSSEGQPRVIGPRQPIVAAPGDDVILPCHLEPRHNVEWHTVEWSKTELKPDPSDLLGRVAYVHLHRNQQNAVDMQLAAYIGRTDLPADGLRLGNISLKIRNVTPEDAGEYRCFIPKLNGKVKESILRLIVVPNTVKTSTTETPSLHHIIAPTPGPKDETKGGRSRPGVLIAVVFAVLVVLILGIASYSITRVQNKLLDSEVPSNSSSLANLPCPREQTPDLDVDLIRDLYWQDVQP